MFLISATTAMKLISRSFAALVLASTALHAQTLGELQDDYVDQEFGMFLHFNMGTFTGEEWASPSQPVDTFNPVGLDTDQWATAAVSAGMTYAVLTTKHHDGFALWDSSQSTYDVASTTWYANAEAATPGSGDIVKRYADSFHTAGLNVCLYYSIWDKSNGIDGTLSGTDATNYVKAELTELLTNYGTITCIWTDGWGWQGGYGYVDYTEVYNHIKTLSPATLLVENNHSESNTDIRTWEQNFPTAGNTFPSEASATIRADNKWFWSAGADNLKSVGNLISQRLTCNERSAAYLLDVTPNQSGQIPASQVTALGEIGAAPGTSPVNWGPAFELETVGDLDLTGANIVAFNGGNENATVGGVTFDYFTGPDFGAVTAQPAGQNTTASDDLKSWAGDQGVYSLDTGDFDLNILLDTHIYTDTPVDTTTSLSGLTIGQWYRIQIVAPADDRSCCSTRTVVVDGTRLIHRFADLDGDTQSHVTTTIGTFEATGNTLNIVTSGSAGGGWSALLLSEIADPAATPELTNPSVESITATGAQADVTLASTNAEVTLYWDTVDQGTGTWTNSNPLGPQIIGPVTGAITGLSADTRYFYRFHAINTTPDPDTEDWSTAGTSFGTSLAGKSVTDLLATTLSSTEIDLDWTDNFNSETGFTIERSPDGISSWAIIGTVAADEQFYTDSGLTAGTAYHYRVTAFNESGDSDPSNVDDATTDPPVPFTVQAWFRMGDDGVGGNNLPQDSSANGYHFVSQINGAAITTSASGGGYDNDAYYSFNGSDQAFYGIGYDAPEDNVGIEVWVRTSDLAQTNEHLFGTGSNVNGLNIGYDAGGNRGWFGAVGGINFVGTVGTANYTAGDWIHLAVVRDNGTSTFYVNGSPSGTLGSAPNNATQPHMAVVSGGGSYFGGDLAEARIFTFDPGQFNVSDLLYPAVAGDPYGNWTGGFTKLTDPDPELDFEHDSLDTGIEWVVGGDPTAQDAPGVAPTFDNTSDPSHFLFTFRRRDEADADPNTTIVVEYGSDLTSWRNTADHGAIDGVIIDDSTDLGGGFHEVTVSIPRSLEVGGMLYARLNVTITIP